MSKEELKKVIEDSLEALKEKRLQKWRYNEITKNLRIAIDRYSTLVAKEKMMVIDGTKDKIKELEALNDKTSELNIELRKLEDRKYKLERELHKLECDLRNEVKEDLLDKVSYDILVNLISF